MQIDILATWLATIHNSCIYLGFYAERILRIKRS